MRLGLALIAVWASAVAMGCGFNQEGIPPARDQIFYPGGILVDPTGEVLYVVNSNADLRYNDGTLAVVDIVSARNDLTLVQKAQVSHEVCSSIGYVTPLTSDKTYCCWDALDHSILDCDERQYLRPDATVKIGSFGSAIDFAAPSTTIPGQRLLVAVRGNASITSIDATVTSTVSKDLTNNDVTTYSATLNCTTGTPKAGELVECDTDHQVSQLTDPPGPTNVTPTVLLPEEPYALAVDPANHLLYVGHLRGGFLSAIDLTYPVPKFIGAFPSIFPNDVTGSNGVTSLNLTQEGVNTGRIYATSRFLARAGAFAPVYEGPLPVDQNLDYDPSAHKPDLFLANAGDVFVSPLPGAEIRGIQVIPGLDRTFLLQRTPPALVSFDTINGQNTPSDLLEMCDAPTFLHMHSPTNSLDDEQLFVTCFQSGQVYVVDPYVPRLVNIIEVGRGPAGLAFSLDGKVAYVVGFGSNNVSVIDLDPASVTRYHVVERIGFPSAVPR